MIWLIDDCEYGIFEGFVYNDQTRHWLRYRKNNGGLPTELSISELLQFDLDALL